MDRPEPFRLCVSTKVLEDLRSRLLSARWPDQLAGSANANWEYGTELGYIKCLARYWASDAFNWRKQEATFNSIPQFKVAGRGGRIIHFIHKRNKRKEAPALLLAHGWPGSVYEFHKIIPYLADHFHIVAPSIPGYGFSEAPSGRGFTVVEAARDFDALMHILGYREYFAQGGDWGSVIVQNIARLSMHVRAIHINMPTPSIRGDNPMAGVTDEEKKSLAKAKRFSDYGFGYQHIQMTRPQTLSYALNDSPVGLLAWIVEKFRDWSDCNGDLEAVHSRDTVLTNVMLYWVSGTIGSSMRLYYESQAKMPGTNPEMHTLSQQKVTVPTAVAQFPHELFIPPRVWCEQSYNLQRYTTFNSGGHFAALEKPAELAKDIIAFFLNVHGHGKL